MNAKQELVEHIGNKKVKCGVIEKGGCEWPRPRFVLKIGHSQQDLADFLSNLDYETRNDGYSVFGVIWYEDGTWTERQSSGWSEWWEHITAPDFYGMVDDATLL